MGLYSDPATARALGMAAMNVPEAERNRRAHYLNLISHRSNDAGKPRPGFKKNVEMLKREVAKIDARLSNGG